MKNCNNVLFLAMGGGGDIALAATLALAYERCGGKSVVGSIVWERYVIDPVPGPIHLEELFNVLKKGDGYVIVDRNTYAVRGGRKVIPQVVNASDVLNREMVVFDVYRGPKGLAKALNDFKDLYGVDVVIGVDVGGDVIAEGFEDNLWSPLADAIVAAALAHLDRTYISIASPGADGELMQEYIEKRVRRIARLGGYVGGYILSANDILTLKKLLSKVVSEASSIPLKVLESDVDVIDIRDGSRSVRLSLLNLAVLILDAVTVVRDSIARYIYEANSLEEARNILNKLTIVTEYDIEEEIYRELQEKGKESELDLVEIRDKLRKRLVKLHIQ